MTDTRNTPGPWISYTGHDGQFKYQPYIMSQPDGDSLPIVVAVIQDTEQRDANAAIIAAAPDILAALESIMQYAIDWSIPTVIWDKAVAVITKAKGE